MTPGVGDHARPRARWAAGPGAGDRAGDEARRYESLIEKERYAFWNEEAESIEAEAESHEIDLQTGASQ